MNTKAFFMVTIVVIVLAASIYVGEFFFKMLGVDIDKVPVFLRPLIHLIGLVPVLWLMKKFLNK